MPSYALSLEKRDPTPEQTFARLVKLFELHDDFRREWVAAVVRRYADAYPQIDLAPFRFELVRALNDDYPGVRLLIADASPITKLVGPALVQSSLKPCLKSSEQGLRNAAQELLFRAGFTNIVVDRTNAP